MSYDLEVYKESYGSPAPLRASDGRTSFRRRYGAIARAQGCRWARRTKRTERHLCTADGPLKIDEDDDHVPESVRASLLSVGWTGQISRPFDLGRADASLVEDSPRTTVRTRPD